MKHLNPQLEKLEERIAPDFIAQDGIDISVHVSSSLLSSGLLS